MTRPAVREVPAALAAAALAALVLTWATWQPYLHEVPLVHDTGTLGPSLLQGTGGALDDARSSLLAVWPALVAGLLLAAAVEVLLPARWLRRRGAAVGPALAVWVGNPALNPVVLAFAVFVLPWELVALRVAFGVLIVAGTVLLVRRRSDAAVLPAVDDAPPTPRRFAVALGRLAVRLLPEYLLLVVVLGALRGVLVRLAAAVAGGSAVAGLVALAV